jgi:arylsulfatase A-like enzyme
VPFVVKGPGIPAGKVCHVPVAAYDLLPTFYEWAGGTAPLPGEVDGVSLKPLLRNPPAEMLARRDGGLIFHRPGNRVSAIRQGDFKLLLNWDRQGRVASRELYRVAPDPREQGHDVAGQDRDRVGRMEATLLAYLKSVKAETVQSLPARKGKKAQDDL